MRLPSLNITRRRSEKHISNSKDSGVSEENIRLSLLFFIIVSLLVVVSGLIAFFISVRGEEETLVPNVVSADLLVGINKLQEKMLLPKVEARFSADYEKWEIITQDPNPGTLVKAGRPVMLVVSRGPIIDKVGNYVGRNLDEVKLELRTLFASYRELIKIREPVARVTDAASEGTILAQNPSFGTLIDGVVEMELVVSKGPRGDLIELSDYLARPFEIVRNELAVMNLPFVFRVREAVEGELSGIIVSQSPEVGQEMSYGSFLQLEMTQPEVLEEGFVFGMIEVTLPEYEILVDLKLELITPGVTRTILRMKHPGGPVSIPYIAEENGQLVVSLFEDEILTQPTR